MNSIEKLINKLCPNDVQWKELGEITITKGGYTPSKKKNIYWQNGSIPWFRMEDIRHNGRILDNSIQHVNKCAIRGKPFKENSIILATTATIGEHALITKPFICNQQFTIFTIKQSFEDLIKNKYLYYYFFIINEWCKKNIKTSSFPSVDIRQLFKFKIPIPPIEVQEKIVKILDKFDVLVNDLSQGLPAEIKARNKQYEYYRDKLLSFERK